MKLLRRVKLFLDNRQLFLDGSDGSARAGRGIGIVIGVVAGGEAVDGPPLA